MGIDSDMYNELVSCARTDAKDTFLEEQLGFWLSGPGTVNPRIDAMFPPKAERKWADEVVKLEGTGAVRRATNEEWRLYEAEYNNALNRAISHVSKTWDPEREDDDSEHYNDVCEGAEELILRPTE